MLKSTNSVPASEEGLLYNFSTGDCIMNRTACTLLAVLFLVFSGLLIKVAFAENKQHEHAEAFAACARACADCMNSCASCSQHCLKLLSAGEKDHTKSAVLCNDCAEVCSTAAKLTSRQSPLSTVVCEACAKACDECGAACVKFPQDKHMSDCAKACQDCAAACRQMIKHISN
jgi:hypothetical protein